MQRETDSSDGCAEDQRELVRARGDVSGTIEYLISQSESPLNTVRGALIGALETGKKHLDPETVKQLLNELNSRA